MLITDYLKRDHAKIRVLLDVLQTGLGRSRVAEKARMVDTLHELLELQRAHEAVEDEILMPALQSRAAAVEPRLLSDFAAAHKEIWRRLKDVETCLKSDFPVSTLDRAVRQFLAGLRQHMDQEENSLFPLAELCLPRPQAERLGDEAARCKAPATGPRLPG